MVSNHTNKLGNGIRREYREILRSLLMLVSSICRSNAVHNGMFGILLNANVYSEKE